MIDEDKILIVAGNSQMTISLEEAWGSRSLGALWIISRCLVELSEELQRASPKVKQIEPILSRIQTTATAALMELEQGSFWINSHNI